MPTFEPTFLNIEYFYLQAYEALKAIGFNSAGFSVPLWFKIILVLISIGLMVFIVYIAFRFAELRRHELHQLLEVVIHDQSEKEVRNVEWEKVQALLNSSSESDWRHAIIEADKMLDQMTVRMGLVGDNLGERLKNVEPSDFTTLQSAWEAHKVRNRIAHESGYILTRREARRAIALFEEVFREFGYI